MMKHRLFQCEIGAMFIYLMCLPLSYLVYGSFTVAIILLLFWMVSSYLVLYTFQFFIATKTMEIFRSEEHAATMGISDEWDVNKLPTKSSPIPCHSIDSVEKMKNDVSRYIDRSSLAVLTFGILSILARKLLMVYLLSQLIFLLPFMASVPVVIIYTGMAVVWFLLCFAAHALFQKEARYSLFENVKKLNAEIRPYMGSDAVVSMSENKLSFTNKNIT